MHAAVRNSVKESAMNETEKAGARAEATVDASKQGSSARRARFWAGLNVYLTTEEATMKRHTPDVPVEETDSSEAKQ
jgi:hypothetical protein